MCRLAKSAKFWLLTATRRGRSVYTPGSCARYAAGSDSVDSVVMMPRSAKGCASALVSFTTCSGLSEDTSREKWYFPHETCPDWSRSRRTISSSRCEMASSSAEVRRFSARRICFCASSRAMQVKDCVSTYSLSAYSSASSRPVAVSGE